MEIINEPLSINPIIPVLYGSFIAIILISLWMLSRSTEKAIRERELLQRYRNDMKQRLRAESRQNEKGELFYIYDHNLYSVFGTDQFNEKDFDGQFFLVIDQQRMRFKVADQEWQEMIIQKTL